MPFPPLLHRTSGPDVTTVSTGVFAVHLSRLLFFAPCVRIGFHLCQTVDAYLCPSGRNGDYCGGSGVPTHRRCFLLWHRHLVLLYGYYRAIRMPGMSVVLTVLSLGTRVVLSYWLASIPKIGVTGIWWSIPIGWLIADVVGIWCYRYVKGVRGS